MDSIVYKHFPDLRAMAQCLAAIRTSEQDGRLDNHPELLRILQVFEKAVLKKLYLRTIRNLTLINAENNPNAEWLGGDFSEKNFLFKDFHVGSPFVPNPSPEDRLPGDFEGEDFFYSDFYVAFLDTSATGYAAMFQSILNMLKEIDSKDVESIDQEYIYNINEALQEVLEAYQSIQDLLNKAGLNPCVTVPVNIYKNSKGVYLQVSGSDGIDGIAQGFHLRWSLTGEMGNHHLPKGNHYQTPQTVGFNKPDDFVRLYRTPYTNIQKFVLDFEYTRPLVNYVGRTWRYKINRELNGQMVTNEIQLFFSNAALYKRLSARYNPTIQFVQFLRAYNDVITINLVGKSAFAVNLVLARVNTENAIFKIEGHCHLDGDDAVDDAIIRKTVSLNSGNETTATLKAENLVSLKLKKSLNGNIRRMEFETYHDFIESRPASAWVEVGNGFAISTNDTQVYERLENSSYLIDNRWPQYRDGLKVRSANYINKWSQASNSELTIKDIVSKYLSLSHTDSRAVDTLNNQLDPLKSDLNISYLDILNLQAFDYHIARMLGLGYIDTTADSGYYIYQLRYVNKKSLTSAENVTYAYTSRPVNYTDKLVPEKPQIRPLKYGLPGAANQSDGIFDEKGYTKLDEVRAVNVGRAIFPDEMEEDYFFSNLTEVADNNIFTHPKPVFYGIAYRSAESQAYVKPEITHIDETNEYLAYDDQNTSGSPEPSPVLDNLDSLYVHFESESGIHYYAIYGINWFSIASPLSNEVGTDAKAFPKINRLIPPQDVSVQYIQTEKTLLFTTNKEQEWLSGRMLTFPGEDVSFTRITFNWLDILDVSHLKTISTKTLNEQVRANQVKAYFNPELPLELIGRITAIFPVSGYEEQLKLITGPHKLVDGSWIKPELQAKDFFRFRDALLSTTNGQYRILYLEAGNNGPVITIEKVASNEVVNDTDQSDLYGTVQKYRSPETGSRFTVTENLSNSENWYPVEGKVSLQTFANPNNPEIEISADSEGNLTKLWVGGLHDAALVEPLFGGADAANDMPGFYRVTFANTSLTAHPQINIPFDPADVLKNNPIQNHIPHVEWYKGIIRVPLAGNPKEIKQLEVLRIEQTNPLVLYISDSSYQENPIAHSSSNGSTVKVNFHPGYRTYFFTEQVGAYLFNGSHILPAQNENAKKTLLGLQSADYRDGGSGISSKVSMPAVLLSRLIDEPIQPDLPQYLDLKVRPDATGNAAFTFDIKIKPTATGKLRNPFGFMFYRTTAQDVLEALYQPQTVSLIQNKLNTLAIDSAFNQRYMDLVNLVFDAEHPDQFKIYGTMPNAYGFPLPDKNSLILPQDTLAVKKEKYATAIRQTLLPLTAQTPLFNYIKTGYYTSNEIPVIRDLDGNLLNSSDVSFNPFPMVRKFTKTGEPNTTYIRFTDYFLNGASRNLYFYAGAEVNDQLENGRLSPFAGPVSILQSMPSVAPVVSRLKIDTGQFFTQAGITVTFYLPPFSPEDHISKIRVYRTFNEANTLTIQLFDQYFDSQVKADANGEITLVDNFEGLSSIPFGDHVYYRLAGIRMINNEQNEEEEVLTFSSALITVKLIDSSNPEVPKLVYNAQENKLVWKPSVNNGFYYLYKQNNRGNWEKVYDVAPPLSGGTMSYVLPEPLILLDEEGNKIYYRYKLQVQNSTGLFNLQDYELTIQA